MTETPNPFWLLEHWLLGFAWIALLIAGFLGGVVIGVILTVIAQITHAARE